MRPLPLREKGDAIGGGSPWPPLNQVRLQRGGSAVTGRSSQPLGGRRRARDFGGAQPQVPPGPIGASSESACSARRRLWKPASPHAWSKVQARFIQMCKSASQV